MCIFPHCFSGINSFVVASLGRTVRGFKLDGDQHEEAMVPIGGACENCHCMSFDYIQKTPVVNNVKAARYISQEG